MFRLSPNHIFAALVIAFALNAFGAQLVSAQETKTPHNEPIRDDLDYTQRQACPPYDKSGKNVPPLKENGRVVDDDINKDGAIDYLLDRWHWDDGNGNDLTVERWCVSSPKGYYASERVIRSKDQKNTTIASPGGVGGTVDPGHC